MTKQDMFKKINDLGIELSAEEVPVDSLPAVVMRRIIDRRIVHTKPLQSRLDIPCPVCLLWHSNDPRACWVQALNFHKTNCIYKGSAFGNRNSKHAFDCHDLCVYFFMQKYIKKIRKSPEKP